MFVSILLSGTIIFMCESNYFLQIRIFLKEYIIFFNGKKAVIENIFIGIFASSLIALIGYVLENKNEKSSLKLEIIKTFKNFYFEYYEIIGNENIKDIRERFMRDEIISKISYCSVQYKKVFLKRDDIYLKAIRIMKWAELYYTNIFCLYAALCEIEKDINKIKKHKKEVEEWKEKGLTVQLLHDSQGILSVLQKDYDNILAEINKRIKDNLKEKKKKDCGEMIEIKYKFGILDDKVAAFLWGIGYIQETRQNIGK